MFIVQGLSLTYRSILNNLFEVFLKHRSSRMSYFKIVFSALQFNYFFLYKLYYIYCERNFIVFPKQFYT